MRPLIIIKYTLKGSDYCIIKTKKKKTKNWTRHRFFSIFRHNKVYIREKKWNDHLNRRSNVCVCLVQWKRFFGVCRFVIWDRLIYWVTVRCENRVANFLRLQSILDCVLYKVICFSGLKRWVFARFKVDSDKINHRMCHCNKIFESINICGSIIRVRCLWGFNGKVKGRWMIHYVFRISVGIFVIVLFLVADAEKIVDLGVKLR